MAGEDDTDYLARMERVSRYSGFSDEYVLRKQYSLVLSVNSLRDIDLWVNFIAKRGLDWEKQKIRNKPRLVARNKVDVFGWQL